MPTRTLPTRTLPISDVSTCCGIGIDGGLTREQAERSATLLKAVADPVRLRLLSAIRAADAGEACVCDLTPLVGLSQPTVSHHLKVLVEAGPPRAREARHLGLVPPRPLPPRRRRRHLPLTRPVLRTPLSPTPRTPRPCLSPCRDTPRTGRKTRNPTDKVGEVGGGRPTGHRLRWAG